MTGYSNSSTMKTARSSPVQGCVVLALATGLILLNLWGCATAPSGETTVTDPTDRTPTEVACEVALLKLSGLIENHSGQNTVASGALAEAIELYRLGRQLYLEREYDLALELAEEGIELLEEKK